MITAPYPQKDCETVGEYNSRHWGKAWRIVGMTWQSEAYCCDCVRDWPTYEHDLIESPVPVFASDEYGDMTCDVCNNHFW